MKHPNGNNRIKATGSDHAGANHHPRITPTNEQIRNQTAPKMATRYTAHGKTCEGGCC